MTAVSGGIDGAGQGRSGGLLKLCLQFEQPEAGSGGYMVGRAQPRKAQLIQVVKRAGLP